MKRFSIFCRSILSKSKHHGFQSIRGSAALAAIIFNRGRSGLVDFFKQYGVSVSTTLFDHLLATDDKRMRKSSKSTATKHYRSQRKALDRNKSSKAKEDISDYHAGGF